MGVHTSVRRHSSHRARCHRQIGCPMQVCCPHDAVHTHTHTHLLLVSCSYPHQFDVVDVRHYSSPPLVSPRRYWVISQYYTCRSTADAASYSSDGSSHSLYLCPYTLFHFSISHPAPRNFSPLTRLFHHFHHHHPLISSSFPLPINRSSSITSIGHLITLPSPVPTYSRLLLISHPPSRFSLIVFISTLSQGHGIFTHFLNGLQNNYGRNSQGKNSTWEECVGQFDVDAYASEAAATGAKCVNEWCGWAALSLSLSPLAYLCARVCPFLCVVDSKISSR